MWRSCIICIAAVVAWLSICCEATENANKTFKFACRGVYDQCAELGWRVVQRRRCSWWGYESECAPPRSAPAPTGAKPSARHLTLAAVNIFQGPYLLKHDGQAERTCRIPQALLSMVPDADVIVLSEAFSYGCVDANGAGLDEVFKNYGYNWSVRPKPTIILLNSGLLILSKWPILAHESETYKRSAGVSLFIEKGFAYVKINKLGSTYHIIGTHMQDEATDYRREIRISQAKHMAAFIKAKHLPSTEPLIIAGDLNVDLLSDRKHSYAVFDVLNVAPPKIASDSLNYTWPLGEAASKNPPLEWLDYILYSKSHAKPKEYKLWSKEIKADKEFRYCSSAPLQPFYVSPSRFTCAKTGKTKYLSDHLAVYARFAF